MVSSKSFLITLCFLLGSNLAFSSAWLTEKGKFKIITELEFKKFHDVRSNYAKDYTNAEINYFKINTEYGVSQKRSLISEINFSNLHSYRYIIEDKQRYYVVSKKSQRFIAFPDKFDSASLGIKNKIFKRVASAASHDLSVRFFKSARNEKFELGYKIAYGKNLLVFKRDFFIQAEYLLNFNPFFYNYDNKLAFSLGFRKSPKKMYILYLENHHKSNYYDKFLKKKANLAQKFNETRVQLATITRITKKISFQKAVFTTLNREKSFASSGVNFGLWFSL
jgi:hypothetical protein